MNTTPQKTLSHHRAFTLIELLVVITIIAVLAGLAIPGGQIVMAKMTRTATLKTMKDIETGITMFRSEYNRLPVDTPLEVTEDDAEPMATSADNDLIYTLMGKADSSGSIKTRNKKEIPFCNFKAAKNGVNGYIDPSGGSGAELISLVDTWGRPYMVWIDTNQDNRIRNPDFNNTDSIISSNAPEFLSQTVLVSSDGPDRLPNTKDDIVTWR
jgi:prepilin-type N-terminal cleavage/methylation domain-containing protein